MLLEEGDEVHLVPPKIDVVRTVHVESIQVDGESKAIIRFREVDSIDVAEQLVGMHCLVDSAILGENVGVLDSASKDALEGWELIDRTSGRRGRILRSWSASGNLLGEVALADEGDDAPARMVPLADDLIIETDEGAHRIVLALPNGIFDL